MLAHMTVNGATLRTGDLYASGTVSGPRADQRGSLIELAWNGREPVSLPDGTERAWLQDGDEVVIAATARGPTAHGSAWAKLGARSFRRYSRAARSRAAEAGLAEAGS